MIGFAVAAGIAATAACDPNALHLHVTRLADGVDLNPGNGICEVTLGLGDCSIRAAVMEANATAGFDNIELDNNVTYPLTIAGTNEDASATGDLDITDSVTIRGLNVTDVGTIDATGIDRALDVRSGTLLVVSTVVRGGSAPTGAGIRVNTGAAASLATSELRNNSATAGSGGIDVGSGSTVYVNSSTIAGNTGTSAGGIGGAGAVQMRQSTVSGNTASSGTGGISASGPGSLIDYSTIAANSGTTAGGLSTTASTRGTAIDSTSGPDCSALLTSAGYNIASDATCVDGTVSGDLSNGAVLLGPLGYNGGLNRTHLPGLGSDLTDHVPSGFADCGGAINNDQRFSGRPLNGACDTGSVEVTTQSLIVNHNGDATDALPGDGLCQDLGGNPGDCSLRAAIREANATAGPGNISITSGLSPNLTIAGAGEDANATGDLDITEALTIDGNGVFVSAGYLDRVFDVRGGTVEIDDLRIGYGSADAAGGAGVLGRSGTTLLLDGVEVFNNTLPVDSQGAGVASRGQLTIEDSWIHDNTGHTDGEGGGVALGQGANLTMKRSLVNNNYGGDDGGGLYYSFGQTVLVENTTITGNTVDNTGGGIGITCNTLLGACPANAPTTVLNNVTLVGNTAGVNGGGIDEYAGASTYLLNSVVGDNNGPGCDVNGTVASGGHNYVDCALTPAGTGDTVGSAPMLDPLANNGGPVQTMSPQVGSPLINTGDPGTPGTGGVTCAATDARGIPRGVGANQCDRGAFETYAPISLTVNHGGDAVDSNLIDGVCQDLAGSPGQCSLRAAIMQTNAWPGTADTITVQPAVTTITLDEVEAFEDNAVNGDLDVTDSLTIVGNGTTIDANGMDRLFHLPYSNSGSVGLTNATLTGAVNGDGGGGTAVWVQSGDLTLDGVTISGNNGNGADGSAVESFTGGTIEIRRSTISGNQSSWSAITNYGSGAISISASTITRHQSQTNYGALAAYGGTITAAGSIVADQVGGAPDCVPGYAALSAGYNLASDGTCLFAGTGDVQNQHAQLSPLLPNGGSQRTHLPAATSPATNAVPNGTAGLCDGTFPSDQRNLARPSGTACEKGAVEVDPSYVGLNLTVNNGLDDVDSNPGNGVCQDQSGGAGQCSLRAAILEANAHSGTDTITMGAVTTNLSRVGASEDAGLTGDLDITDHLVVTGNNRVVDANDLDRVFEAGAPLDSPTVTLNNLTVRDGTAPGGEHGGGIAVRNRGTVLSVNGSTLTLNATAAGDGAAVSVTDGTATITGSTMSNNTLASGYYGGAAVTRGGGTLTVANSTMSGNTSNADGGAVLAWDQSSIAINQSTISANTSAYHAVSSYSSASITIVMSTITKNTSLTSSAALADYGAGTFTVRGSIIADQVSGPSCYTGYEPTSLGHNLVSDSSCLFAGTGDVVSNNVALGALRSNGGSTLTHLPLATSAAVNTIANGTAGLCDGTFNPDQRGQARPTNGSCDKGAVETVASFAGLSLTVNNATDVVDSNPGNGTCQNLGGGGGQCSLRAAIMEANARGGADTITISGGINPSLSLAGTDEDGAATGDLDITDHLTINGGGATVDANGLDRVFHVGAAEQTPTVVLNSLVITDGNAYASSGYGDGGGIYVDNAATRLTVSASTITANTTVNGDGGGIAVNDGIASLTGSTLSNNTVGSGYAGGVVGRAAGSVTITNSTLSGNTANNDGGVAIAWDQSSITINQSTISGNTSGYQALSSYSSGSITLVMSTITKNTSLTNSAALANYGGGTFTIRGSILADQVSGPSCYTGYQPTSLGHNLVSDATCLFAGTGDVVSNNVALGALRNNGGSTLTHLPLATSAAINTIANGTAGLCDGTFATDQRGQARPNNGSCEKGAVETNSAFTGLSLTVNNATDVVDSNPGDGTCQNLGGGGGQCSLRAAIMEANARGGADTITISGGINPSLTLAGTDEDGAATGDLDIVDHLTINGGGATVDANALDRVFHVGAAEQTPTVVLNSLVITDGNAYASSGYGDGGGIYVDNAATRLTVTASTITANTTVNGDGGGVTANDGIVTITGSTVSNNSVPGGYNGGAVVTRNAGTVTVSNSTISGNTSPSEGSAALAWDQSSISINQSTISGNSAGYSTVVNYGTGSITVVMSTVTKNSSSTTTGALARYGSGAFTLRGSIVADQTSGASCVANPYRPTSLGYNHTSTGCGFGSTGDVQNVVANLAALANNGGTTLTHLPNAASAVLNTIPNGTAGLCDGTFATDQRGGVRLNGAACDKGAVER